MFVERVRALLKEKGITDKEMLVDLDINKNQMTRWAKEGTIPGKAILIAIAYYLDTTPEYLSGDTDEREKMPGKYKREDKGEAMKMFENSKIPRLFELMTEKNIKAAQITRDLNISSGNISDWKSGKAAPSNVAMVALANYLDTTVSYLTGKTDEKEKSMEKFEDSNEGEAMKSINNDLLISRIEEMAKEKNLKMNAVFVESGAGKNFKSNLKTANPSLGKLTLIANYLGTTVAYLTGETDKKENRLNFWDNFVKLCANAGKKPNPVAKELGISSGAVTSWKSGRVPHDTTLIKIADYFGVTVDELMQDKKEKPPEKSEGSGEDEVRAFEKTLEGLTQEELQKVLSYAEFLKQQRNS